MNNYTAAFSHACVCLYYWSDKTHELAHAASHAQLFFCRRWPVECPTSGGAVAIDAANDRMNRRRECAMIIIKYSAHAQSLFSSPPSLPTPQPLPLVLPSSEETRHVEHTRAAHNQNGTPI